MSKLLKIFLIFFFCLIFFSFRLLDVPRGITIDEAAFGYNASLIAETLRDENGRFLPVFVLSLQGRDWRQPVAQYMQVAMFKIFGRSLFNLKFVSVLAASFSGLLIFLLGLKILGKKFGFLALAIFLTTPVVVIHSHLALDNISPLPFILLWLFGLRSFNDKKNYRYILLAGVSLGISFYAHKSMRSAVPVWTILTVLYLFFAHVKNLKPFSLRKYKPLILFLASIAPFYIISPLLNYKYAGAVYGFDAIGFSSIYSFFNFYLSNFDLSFLFVKGDTILHHSTGIHGMFLLAALPLLVYGIYLAFKEKNPFFIFLVSCFFVGPLLLGLTGSIHRASRIIFLVPFFCLISAYGGLRLLQFKERLLKNALLVFSFIFILNFFDFINYYWFKYPQDTYHIFYSPVGIDAYKKLDKISKKENLTPLISADLLKTAEDSGTVEDFARSLYFVKPNAFTKEQSSLPQKSVLLTRDKFFKEGKKTDSGVENYFLYNSD